MCSVIPVDQWRYQRDGKEEGPIPEPDLKRLLAEGSLPSDTLVFADYLGHWTPASQVAVFIGSTNAGGFDYGSTTLSGDAQPYSVPGFSSQAGSVPGWTPEHAFVSDQRAVAGFTSEPHSVPAWGTDSQDAGNSGASVQAAETPGTGYRYHDDIEASKAALPPVLVPNTVPGQQESGRGNSKQDPQQKPRQESRGKAEQEPKQRSKPAAKQLPQPESESKQASKPSQKALRKQKADAELARREKAGVNVDSLRKDIRKRRPWHRVTDVKSLIIAVTLALPVLFFFLIIFLAIVGFLVNR